MRMRIKGYGWQGRDIQIIYRGILEEYVRDKCNEC